MIQIDFFPLYGFMIGIVYTNEDIEECEEPRDDLRNTIQIFLGLFGVNIHWFTDLKK